MRNAASLMVKRLSAGVNKNHKNTSGNCDRETAALKATRDHNQDH